MPSASHPASSGRAHFENEGYAIFREVLDAELIAEARQHVEWLLQKNPGTRPEQLHHTLMTEDAFWVRLISDDRLLEVAEQFIGPNLALFASHYICKRPHDGQAVLWHQDGSYWPLEPMEVVTLWLALDDTDPENGCMRVIPRTQHLRLLTEAELIEQKDGKNVLGSGIDPAQIDESRAVDVRLRAGDVSVHHPNVIHGSNANTSARWRRGLTIRYIPATTRILGETPFPSAFMLRGQPVAGGNTYQPWPRYVEGRHMPFRDWQAWNEKCERKNAEYREFLVKH
ncbi:MAG: phytanoyl-CoA dioxygenase family protein [candidate division KSB1 bacterium]|nr:phytanoyl-CoA dioxygenase family protein [candidate division KSB1 bacterium]MDZ7276328.1 phytanoyl-CoA dioxygenase family protein [candidate division KSB1 bacterium]MDZ7287719.1 phytanoyl-CoA dioxygenase family protein [candidate division KSB1 bacterium]MDZ7299941.1 phytanoyl-CoA dioxygenase family protein [candidate division KSB1 bacterium]MDZ7305730.1 phytanoyl-CoA dioxygenase family protein [candidate division KSB1 bacterium]